MSPDEYRCPGCRAAVSRAAGSFPFCSARCRWSDLAGWFEEKYRISAGFDRDGPAGVGGAESAPALEAGAGEEAGA